MATPAFSPIGAQKQFPTPAALVVTVSHWCRLQRDLDLGRRLHEEGTLEAISCTASARARGFIFPQRWADIQAYLTKLEEPWLTTLLRRGWRLACDAVPGATAAVERVLSSQLSLIHISEPTRPY